MTYLLGTISVLALLMILLLPGGYADGANGSALVQSSQILAEIKNNSPVDYTDVDVIGDLDLSSISGPIISPISIKSSKIHGVVIFNNSVIKEPVDFERTHFLKPAYFFQTQFVRGADFDHAQFNDAAIFRKSFLNETSNFAEAKFQERVDFRDSILETNIADFGGADFEDDAQFIETKFRTDNANFEWTHFNKSAKFWLSVFGDRADFRGAHFGDIADFYEVQFNNTADFWGAQFEKDLFLADVSFKIFRIEWASIDNKLNCNGPPYLQLIKNFKDLEQFEDADSCYYQYRDWRRVTRPLEWAKLTDYVAWLSCGYGVRWVNTLLSSIFVVLLFGMYYESFSLRGMLRIISIRNSNSDLGQYTFKKNLKRAIAFSVITLLSLPSDWFPFGRDEYAEFIRRHLVASIFERIIGWGLMLLMIGTLSRLMVRY